MNANEGISEMKAVVLGLLGMFTILYICSLPPKINGHKAVVQIENSLGYDFDKDGDLDKAAYFPIGVSPRAPGGPIEIDKDSLEFRALQEAYSNK